MDDAKKHAISRSAISYRVPKDFFDRVALPKRRFQETETSEKDHQFATPSSSTLPPKQDAKKRKKSAKKAEKKIKDKQQSSKSPKLSQAGFDEEMVCKTSGKRFLSY